LQFEERKHGKTYSNRNQGQQDDQGASWLVPYDTFFHSLCFTSGQPYQVPSLIYLHHCLFFPKKLEFTQSLCHQLQTKSLIPATLDSDLKELINLGQRCAKGRASLNPHEDHEELDKQGMIYAVVICD